MASQDDVRRIALALPATAEGASGLTFSVSGKQFAWPWLERVDPKRPRVPNRDVLAVRVQDELDEQSLVALDPDIFFTEPHHDGYPAVLVRLAAIGVDLLEDLLTDAWRHRAPRRLVASHPSRGTDTG